MNKKKFPEAIAILEDLLSSGVGDVYILLLLSVAYLYTDQFGRLARFITKMKEKNPGYLPLIQLEAFLRIKSAARYTEALKVYLDLAAQYPADPHIHRGRNLLRDVKDFEKFQKDALLQDFVYIPRPPRALSAAAGKAALPLARGLNPSLTEARLPSGPAFIIVFTTALLALFIAGGWYVYDSDFFRKGFTRLKKPGRDFSVIDMISVSGTDYDLIKNMKRENVPVYYQSALQMTDDFNRARRLIKSEQYNEALSLLNGLYNSNVNFVVKEKVNFLIKFVINLEDREFVNIPFETVRMKKFLYRGYAIRWNGIVGKIREKGDSQIFTLHINRGGEEGSGEADVFSDRIIPGLKKGSPVLLEGVIADFLGKDKTVYIVSRNVRLLR